MRRRDFITLLGGAIAWPVTAGAQRQAGMPVIGFFEATASADGYAPMVAAFLRGRGEAGFIPGRNVAIEYRWAADQSELAMLAADLVQRQVAVIAVGGRGAVEAAKNATATIPIVFRLGVDPVDIRLVTSLNRPGGNLTGIVTLAEELVGKRLELVRELLPAVSSVAVLADPKNNNMGTLLQDAQRATTALGLGLHVLRASTDSELDRAFTDVAAAGAGALVIGSDGFFNSRLMRLGELSARHAVPTIYQYRDFATAGGLISYGASLTDAYRLSGLYAGRVLKGEKPANLPVQQATKIELILNLKTAKALGIAVPLTLLGRADEVIE
jgi:putative ABC transport system substrate-binding protein